MTLRDAVEVIIDRLPDLPDRIAMRMRLLADSLDEHPEHLALKFIGEWAALERRVHILESQMLDSHDEWEWLHSHLAGFLPGAYLDDNTEEDDDEGWD